MMHLPRQFHFEGSEFGNIDQEQASPGSGSRWRNSVIFGRSPQRSRNWTARHCGEILQLQLRM
jgi:hypothetical protein